MLLEIDGIQIDFPFEPYDLQKDYMVQVIKALQSKQNAVLESPTGKNFNIIEFHNFVKLTFET
jgi:Rad3-related DNA helicase